MVMSNDNDWVLAESEHEGRTYIYRFRQSIPHGIEPTDFPHVVTIQWPYDGSEYNGMPKPEVQQPMMRFEEAVSSIEGPRIGFVLIVVTGDNRKEWTWHVRDTDTFMSELNCVLASHETYPIEIYYGRDDNWDEFRNFLSQVGNAAP